MKPAPVQQPLGTMLCGQACVASLARVSLGRAVSAVAANPRRPTWRRDLDRGLRALTGRGLARSFKPVRRGIARIKWGDRRPGHWLVVIGGELRDPWPEPLTPGWRVASWWAHEASPAK